MVIRIPKITKPDLDTLITLAHAPLGNEFLQSLIDKHADEVLMCLNYYRFFYHLVRKWQPPVCIELGVKYGLGSAHMVAAAQEYGGIVIGIDRDNHEIPAHILTQYYPDNYIYHNSDIIAAFPKVRDYLKWEKVRALVFQDSSHHYRQSLVEWELYGSLLAPGSIWIADDILPIFHDPKVDPPGLGMVQYWEGLPGEKYLFPDVLHRGNTMGVVLL